MFSIARLVTLPLALLGVVSASASLLSIPAARGAVRAGSYIVTLKEHAVARTTNFSSLLSSFDAAHVKYEWPTLNSFAATFGDGALLALRASGDVAAIEHDTLGGVASIKRRLERQTDAPWGLQRISQLQKLDPDSEYEALSYNYTYDRSAGRGVDIYIIDSGVLVEHEDFGGRARWGTNFGGYSEVDVEGHGTHVAGTAAGTLYGVAKAANVIAVRVLDDDGVGAISDAIAAVNWVVEEATRRRRPSVINMSLHYQASEALDAAVTAAINAGVHVVVAAGNSNLDVDYWSPGRAPAVITVGASTIDDRMAPFTNHGPLVDIFAPGVFVVSAAIDSLNGTTVMSGTSMASPHVAGLVAYLIGLEGNRPTADVLARIKEFSPDGILTGLPADTINELINNGVRL